MKIFEDISIFDYGSERGIHLVPWHYAEMFKIAFDTAGIACLDKDLLWYRKRAFVILF